MKTVFLINFELSEESHQIPEEDLNLNKTNNKGKNRWDQSVTHIVYVSLGSIVTLSRTIQYM